MAGYDDALGLLRQLTADERASFRDGQWEAIDALATHHRRALVVQRTGWGKSAVYFVATRLLREQGAGATLLVSPLLALMRNQVAAAERVGVRAATINSANVGEWQEIEARVRDGAVDLLLVSPERLNNTRFRAEVLPDLVTSVGMLVVDEAHCISDWGHDFRPDYRRIGQVLAQLPSGVPVLCTTATANDRVVEDIVEQLGDDLLVSRGPLERASLRLSVVDLPDPAARMAWLTERIPALPGSGIVYCLTVADARRVAAFLRQRGIDAAAYTGDDEGDDRLAVEQRLLANEVKVVVATSALGMGFDKPDLAFVVHYQAPGSPIAYYQQVGRAGRALDAAEAVLLRGREDRRVQDHFIATAFPSREQADAVLGLLAARGEPVKLREIEEAVNLRRSRIEGMLKVLDVEGAVEQTTTGWRRTDAPWTYPAERIARVTDARRSEQRAMVAYAEAATCRMAFLRDLLDDSEPTPCRRCDRCEGRPPDTAVDPGLVQAADAFLRGAPLTIEPRKQWLRGGATPRIDAAERAEVGRALAVAGDAGWGRLVAEARSGVHGADTALVDAVVSLVEQWRPEPEPRWLTCIPSASAGRFLDSFATMLGERVGLPFLDALERTRAAPPQREMDNSVQQLRNVDGAFAVLGTPPRGPVLLVDDLVDSGWTMTVCAAELRRAGVEAVHPLALATTFA